jgi:hypothetical protein
MPGKGTTRRSVRVSDDRWKAAKEKAEAEGRSVSDVLNDCLDKFVDDAGGKAKKGK